MFDLHQRPQKCTKPQQAVHKKRFVGRVYAFLSPILIVVLMAALLPACSAAPSKAPALDALAGSASSGLAEFDSAKVDSALAQAVAPGDEQGAAPALVLNPSVGALAGILTSEVKPVTFEPAPTINQGGTCISGYTIDRYHQQRGGGWTIVVTGPDGKKLEPALTARDDGYFFTPKDMVLGAGKYLVELVLEQGWKEYTPARLEVTLDGDTNNASCAEVRFKIEALACLNVHKLDETGYPGQKIGIPGWKMTVTADAGSPTTTVETDGVGKAVFPNLVPGKWKITEESKVGWTNASGSPSSKTMDVVSPRNPGDCYDVYFTNKQVHDSCIIVRKVDSTGKALYNWTIDLTRKDGTQPPQSKNTDLNGAVYFPNLALGEWIVSERVPTGWRAVGDATRTTNLDTPGTDCDEIVFTNERLGCIDGYKINHLEQGLIGWEISAINKSTKETKTVKTDNNGYYRLDGLEMGVWTVSENSDKYPGWVAVTPSEFDVEVKDPSACVHTRFKNRAPSACIDVYKVDAYDGAALSAWQIEVKPAYGGSDKWTQVTDGTGRASFYDLTPGEYIVSEGSMEGWVPVGPTSYKVNVEATGACSVIKFINRQKDQVPMITPPAPPKSPKPYPGGCDTNYTVRPGDTLFNIGLTFHVTVDQLLAVNNIANPRLIYPGMVVCIPPHH